MSRMAQQEDPAPGMTCWRCRIADDYVWKTFFPLAYPSDSWYYSVWYAHKQGGCYNAQQTEIYRQTRRAKDAEEQVEKLLGVIREVGARLRRLQETHEERVK